MYMFLESAHGTVQEVKLEQGQQWHNDLVSLKTEMVDDAPEVAQSAEQPMEQQQGFTLALLYEFELAFLSDFVIHL
jgi:hypothetical protein